MPEPTPIGPNRRRGIRLVDRLYAGINTLRVTLHAREVAGSNPAAPICLRFGRASPELVVDAYTDEVRGRGVRPTAPPPRDPFGGQPG